MRSDKSGFLARLPSFSHPPYKVDNFKCTLFIECTCLLRGQVPFSSMHEEYHTIVWSVLAEINRHDVLTIAFHRRIALGHVMSVIDERADDHYVLY